MLTSVVIMALILGVSLKRLRKEYNEGMGMPEWLSLLALKLTGALAGSVISAWFRRSVRWAFQVVAGVWFGYVSGQWLLDYMAWPMTTDYILLAGSITGAAACSILEGAHSLWPEIRSVAKAWLQAKARGAEK